MPTIFTHMWCLKNSGFSADAQSQSEILLLEFRRTRLTTMILNSNVVEQQTCINKLYVNQ